MSAEIKQQNLLLKILTNKKWSFVRYIVMLLPLASVFFPSANTESAMAIPGYHAIMAVVYSHGLFIFCLSVFIVYFNLWVLVPALLLPPSFYTTDIFIISSWFFVINGIYIGLYFYQQWQQSEEIIKEERKTKTGGFKMTTLKNNLLLSFGEIRGFFIDGDYSVVVTTESKKDLIDFSLDKVEKTLPASSFFRFNRQYIVHRQVVTGYEKGENDKINVLLKGTDNLLQTILVSRTKVAAFKSRAFLHEVYISTEILLQFAGKRLIALGFSLVCPIISLQKISMKQSVVLLLFISIFIQTAAAQTSSGKTYRNFPIVLSVQFHSLSPLKDVKPIFKNVGFGIGSEIALGSKHNWAQQFQVSWYRDKQAGNAILLYTQSAWRPTIVSHIYTELKAGFGLTYKFRPVESSQQNNGGGSSVVHNGKWLFIIPVGVSLGYNKFSQYTYIAPFVSYQILVDANYAKGIPEISNSLFQVGTRIHLANKK